MKGVPYLIINGADNSGNVEFPRRRQDGWTQIVSKLIDLTLQY